MAVAVGPWQVEKVEPRIRHGYDVPELISECQAPATSGRSKRAKHEKHEKEKVRKTESRRAQRKTDQVTHHRIAFQARIFVLFPIFVFFVFQPYEMPMNGWN